MPEGLEKDVTVQEASDLLAYLAAHGPAPKAFEGNRPETIVMRDDSLPLLATNGPSAQLQEIVVDAAARGHDYGTQLVRAVEAECERRGVTQLTVASRRAGGFYDRLGFHESAEYMRRLF